MRTRRLVVGAITLASMLGLAVGPAGSAGAITAHPNSVQRNFNIPNPNTVVIETGLRTTSPVTLHIGFRDVGVPGDSFRATYIDAISSVTGACAASSKKNFIQSLAVRVPSARNFRVRIRWCHGPGDFPAGGQMLIVPN
ncbi:MAG TPA: hypothetical protein VGO03_17100 [Acidimicrobiia bacterium]